MSRAGSRFDRKGGGRGPGERPLRIRVPVSARPYEVVIADSLSRLPPELERLDLGRRAFVLCDRHVAPLYAAQVAAALRRAGLEVSGAVIPAGEQQKSLPRLGWVLDRLLANGLDRGDTLVALGGGVIGDLGGFAAATYLRGIALIQVPTSLLAMVDAAVGGKVGINLPGGKNLVGAFHQPRLVFAPLSCLVTLPRRELRSGLAEVIKAGMIGDASLFAFLERHMGEVGELSLPVLRRAIGGAVRLKARIVARDERESGLRALLNYGHTVGHAIEAATAFRRFRHGEAVALGMAAAGRLALERRLAEPRAIDRQNRLLARAGLPVKADRLRVTDILDKLQHDKKVRSGRLHVVLTHRVGFASLHEQALDSRLKRAISSITTE